ncbi:DUF3846 domain-containing protein [Skermania piniformis]|uniref:DUF3846 domain-containing protein n=2 Tax=Skermania pinensis TaxID=39122 RepID=A0ABX8SAG3_9ACTN|nr:DUF3846 domain-containing protein [Skermania piniformis]QXQ14859.1 DUF3846 domain-containing protein [Skermania piniformis]
MTKIRVVQTWPDLDIITIRTIGRDLASLQAAAGGAWIQAVTLRSSNMILDDEGKLKGLPRNCLAETIAALDGWTGHSYDQLVGPIVFVGPTDDTGEMTHADQLIERLRGTFTDTDKPTEPTAAMTGLVNLTDRAIAIYTDDRQVVRQLPAATQPARLAENRTTPYAPPGFLDGAIVVDIEPARPVGIPAPTPGTWYVVTREIAEVLAGHRGDLLFPLDEVTDPATGTILGYRTLGCL